MKRVLVFPLEALVAYAACLFLFPLLLLAPLTLCVPDAWRHRDRV